MSNNNHDPRLALPIQFAQTPSDPIKVTKEAHVPMLTLLHSDQVTIPPIWSARESFRRLVQNDAVAGAEE